MAASADGFGWRLRDIGMYFLESLFTTECSGSDWHFSHGEFRRKLSQCRLCFALVENLNLDDADRADTEVSILNKRFMRMAGQGRQTPPSEEESDDSEFRADERFRGDSGIMVALSPCTSVDTTRCSPTYLHGG